MKRHHAALIAGLVLFAAGLVVATQFRLSTSLADMLPRVEDRKLARVAAELADSELSRTLIFVIYAEDGERARVAARRLADGLRVDPAIAWVQAGVGEDLGPAWYARYFPHRFGLLDDAPEANAETRFSSTGLAASVQRLLDQLGLPTAPMVKRLAPADPWLAFVDQLGRLERARPEGLEVIDGIFTTADGRHAVVFAATRHAAMDSEAHAPFAARLQTLIAGLEATHVLSSGVHRHAMHARQQIEGDLRRIGVASTIGVLLLFAVLFRSLGLLGLAVLPIVGGIGVALATTLLVFGRVHGLTLTFGATLVGVCLDYPVHLFNQHLGSGLRHRGAVRRGLALGALTTIVGYASLAISPMPAIREIAVFAATGVAVAWAMTRLLVEPMLPRTPRSSAPRERAQRTLERLLLWVQAHRSRQLAPLLLAGLVVGVWLPGLEFRDDVSALRAEDPALAAEDARVRVLVASHESGRVVVVTAPDLEAAMQANDRLAVRLEAAVAAGEIEAVRNVHALLWSEQLQRRNLAVLRARPQLAEQTLAALEEAGFRRTGFAPFERDLTAALAEDATVLTWAAASAPPLEPMFRSFRIRAGDEVGLLSFVRGVRDPVAFGRRVAAVDGATFFDQTAFVQATLGEHRRGAQQLVGIGLLLVAFAVALRYRNLRRTLTVLLPTVLACTTTMALLTAIGASLHQLHLVSLLLVASMSADYGVFLAEAVDDAKHIGATLLSLVIAAVSTALVFGLLGLSSHPALQAIGWTTGIGVAVSLVVAPCLALLLRPDQEVR